jgi:hypothetical protein
MSGVVAALAVQLLGLICGLGILVLAGIVPTKAGSLLAGAGLAYLVGWATILVVQSFAAVIGLAVDLVVPVVVATALMLGAFVRGSAAEEERRGRSSRLSKLASLAMAAAGILIAANILTSGFLPVSAFDAWAQWIPKAEVLRGEGLEASTLWTNPVYVYVNQDYPLGLPILHALQLDAAGGDVTAVHVAPWAFLAAFTSAVLFLLRCRPLWAVAPAVLCFVVAPTVQLQTRTVLGELPLAVMIATGVLLLVLWLDERRPAVLGLGALLLAGAASLKSEGAGAGLIALIAAGIVSWVEGPASARKSALVAAVAVAATLVPWRVWMAHHDVHGRVVLENGLDPGHLADQIGRVQPMLESFFAALARPGENLMLPAAALVLIVLTVCFMRERRSRALLYLGVMVGHAAVVLWANWTSEEPIGTYLPESGRYLLPVTALAAVAVADLGSRFWSAQSASPVRAATMENR